MLSDLTCVSAFLPLKFCLPYFDPSPGQFWTDPRLSFERSENLEKLVVGAEYIKLIWVPDTFFVNEKIALFHQVKCRFWGPLNLRRILFLKPK